MGVVVFPWDRRDRGRALLVGVSEQLKAPRYAAALAHWRKALGLLDSDAENAVKRRRLETLQR